MRACCASDKACCCKVAYTCVGHGAYSAAGQPVCTFDAASKHGMQKSLPERVARVWCALLALFSACAAETWIIWDVRLPTHLCDARLAIEV